MIPDFFDFLGTQSKLVEDERVKETDLALFQTDSKARKAIRSAKKLEEKVDRLALICRAMWELLRERTGLSQEDLIHKVREVDLMDGKLDGKVTLPTKKCTSCGRVMASWHTRCLYCGARRLLDTAFDSMSEPVIGTPPDLES